ncbi:hypothetical protein EST38_g1720 [Candolleomyces aberdarensis]|uniref:Nucleolar complex-associated protein 3 N-terminal domain-containing protein n=1 Tax=Candolleomyces aberdarensis TaxID=2316362 RepID=A0A4Q2DVE4_9AGAR|nr:hypothetical protein EST38_g1720 [Candolleomyces aberdarensis]
MALKAGKKRPAPAIQSSSKKRKLVGERKKPQADGSRKQRLADRGIIPIPIHGDNDTDDDELSEADAALLEEFGGAVNFLKDLDKKGIMRSKKETDRLHELTKPVRRAATPDSLPPVDSNDENDSDAWSSGIDGFSDISDSGSEDEPPSDDDHGEEEDSDEEMPYELAPRKLKVAKEEGKNEIPRLPIKLADGKIQSTGTKVISLNDESEEESSSEEETFEPLPPPREDGSTGARFGRPAIAAVLQTKSRKQRISLAKEQIAGICQEILADPENSLGLLRRLHSFSLPSITTPTEPKPVPNDIVIRKLALLSQLAVFKDILPGYRIRELTEKEKAEKVSQLVTRTREWEQGLVSVYQAYLRLLDSELKERSELADIAIQCMCTLLTEATHFNFRQNLITCIVTRLSKKSWDETSERCLSTINGVFRADLTGEPSLEIVQTLNRMIKERRFKVHANVLSCLLSLRLRTELGVRASQTRVDKEQRHDKQSHKQKAKKKDQPHLSKKAKKALKERKEIQRELREAEAEVDKEERAITQTETLKLLFALYFRILKTPTPTNLLPAALSGIAKFAHLVNIDFFKDLMQVLKDLINTDTIDPDDADVNTHSAPLGDFKGVCHRLLCINTAFELLSGQGVYPSFLLTLRVKLIIPITLSPSRPSSEIGEALNIDLTDFISQLFAMLLPLSLMDDIDKPHPGIQHLSSSPATSTSKTDRQLSVADLLFRALDVVFSPQASGGAHAAGPDLLGAQPPLPSGSSGHRCTGQPLWPCAP